MIALKKARKLIENHTGKPKAEILSRLVLLTDCVSPVAGFEVQYHGFLQEMRQRGVRLATSAEVLPDLIANA